MSNLILALSSVLAVLGVGLVAREWALASLVLLVEVFWVALAVRIAASAPGLDSPAPLYLAMQVVFVSTVELSVGLGALFAHQASTKAQA